MTDEINLDPGDANKALLKAFRNRKMFDQLVAPAVTPDEVLDQMDPDTADLYRGKPRPGVLFGVTMNRATRRAISHQRFGMKRHDPTSWRQR